MSLPREIRQLEPQDVDWGRIGSVGNFVLASWLQSYLEARPLTWVPRAIYYREMEPRLKQLIEEHTDWVRVACPPGEPDQILGWACVGPDQVLHYLYIKRRFRRLGVGRDLLAGLGRPMVCSHWTIHCERRRDLIYRPSAFYEKRETS